MLKAFWLLGAMVFARPGLPAKAAAGSDNAAADIIDF
jgi:hypothetical protein